MTTTKEELKAVWQAARTEAQEALDRMHATYAKSRGAHDPVNAGPKAAAEAAVAKRDAAKAAYSAAQ